MPPRKRAGSGRRAARPTTPTWTETAYTLWRGGCEPVQISDAIRRELGHLIEPADVERLVLELATEDLRASWAGSR